MELLYLLFLSGNNTVIVRNEKEYEDLRNVMKLLGKGKEFDTFGDYNYCKHLFQINGRTEDYMIFEHQQYKGFTFGYDIQSSKDWYGLEPIEASDLVNEYRKVVS